MSELRQNRHKPGIKKEKIIVKITCKICGKSLDPARVEEWEVGVCNSCQSAIGMNLKS